MILGDSDSAGHRTITNFTGLGAGILVSIALGAIRLGAAKLSEMSSSRSNDRAGTRTSWAWKERPLEKIGNE